MATTAQTAQVTEKDISAWAEAKRRLQLRRNQLLTLKARAVKSGNTKTTLQVDADLKEATALTTRAASVDAMLAPFLKAWEWTKEKIGLGDLGVAPLVVGIGVTGALTALIYGINVFDRKMETTTQRYEAEIAAVEKWKSQGLTPAEAVSQVNKTGEQISKEKEDKPLLGDFSGLAKFGLTVALIGGGFWWYMNNDRKVRN